MCAVKDIWSLVRHSSDSKHISNVSSTLCDEFGAKVGQRGRHGDTLSR